jgi:hypothetical protein
MGGPLDYIIVGFEGNRFNGALLQAVDEAIDKEIISLVALSGISKNEDGSIVTLDIANTDDPLLIDFTQRHKLDNQLVTQDAIDEVAELLEPNTVAGFLVVEQLWALPIKKAILEAGGFLLAESRIHPEASAELNESTVE